MKFKKIVCVDNTKLQKWALEELQELSEEKIEVHSDYPGSEEEILERLKGAEAVFVSWQTILDEKIIGQCPDLKYIGMCCSLYDDASANVAVDFARKNNIAVTGIRDYGDPGVAEFIISELIRLLHGFGDHQWKKMPEELTDKKIGIIGLGITGQLLAQCLLPFDPDLFYFSRTRKPEWEEKGLQYLDLHQLLQKVHIVSIHLPKNTTILKRAEFDIFGSGKVLINTSLGLPFEEKAFAEWIEKDGNFAIFDGDGKKMISEEIEKFPNVITAGKSAGWSSETHRRLSQKVLENVHQFLDRQEIH